MLPDPLEQEIAERLAAAGDRARSSRFAAPDRAFSAELRERLMAAAGDRASDRAGDRERVRVAWSLPSLFRVPRLVPVAAATLLLLAGVVAARELYVTIGNRPEASPTPQASFALVAPVESASMLPASGDPSAVASAAEPTAKPTPKPTPRPTAAPTPGLVPLTLAATGCGGGVVLDWSTYEGAGFNHYTTLRSTSSSIPKAWPPQGGAVAVDGTSTTNVAATSAVDAGVAPGSYYYRTMAFNADDGVIGASAVVSAVAAPVGSLGALSVGPDAVAGTDLAWTPYAGGEGCFTWYKLVFSETSATPSYLTGDPYLAAISTPATGSYVTDSADLVSGHTYHFRVQVLKATELGLFVVAQTDVATYTMP